MGALALGYISDKTVFYIVGAVVAMAGIGYLIQRLHTSGPHKMHHRYDKHITQHLAGAAIAYKADTDGDDLRGRIIRLMSENSTDPRILHELINQVVSRINQDLQPTGQLAGLIAERRSGAIDQETFRVKLNEYIRQVGADLDIPFMQKYTLSSRYKNPLKHMMIHQNADFEGDNDVLGSGHKYGWMRGRGNPHNPFASVIVH